MDEGEGRVGREEGEVEDEVAGEEEEGEEREEEGSISLGAVEGGVSGQLERERTGWSWVREGNQ